MITWSPENAEMGKIRDALIRATESAREEARRHGVPIVIWRDGQVVLEDPAKEPTDTDTQDVSGIDREIRLPEGKSRDEPA